MAAAFKEKFGVDLLEGYGCTEMAPVVAVNVPDVDDEGERQRGWQPGSVGHPLPGVVAKIVDPVTGEGPLFGQEGLLLVKGPNRMAGYLGEPEKTAEVMRDGWYVTGDIATIDDAGFIRITDRLSRFSKIGGEMVPHMKIEDQVQRVAARAPRLRRDRRPRSGQGRASRRLLHRPALAAAGSVGAAVPDGASAAVAARSARTCTSIEAIPTLGTGKTDLRAVRQLALESSAIGVRESGDARNEILIPQSCGRECRIAKFARS